MGRTRAAAVTTMGTTTMTGRERISAAMRGDEVDRFPVWLKMANSTWRAGQPEPYAGMEPVELQRAAGCDAMMWAGLGASGEAPHVKRTVTETGGVRRTAYETPDGELVGEERFDPGTQSWHPTEYMVGTSEDLRRLRWVHTDTSYSVDRDAASRARARQDELAADDVYTHSGAGPGPLMNMIQHIAGPVQCIYLMADEPELFGEVLEVMHADRMRCLAATLPHEAADTFWLTENTSTTLISPGIFREFCMPHLRDYGQACWEHGIIPVHHMCGTLNALLEDIDTLPAAANEAYTTRPLGDVSLAEGRRRMPSKCLIGGTNATLWLEPAAKIVETVAADLAECPDRPAEPTRGAEVGRCYAPFNLHRVRAGPAEARRGAEVGSGCAAFDLRRGVAWAGSPKSRAFAWPEAPKSSTSFARDQHTWLDAGRTAARRGG